MPRMRPDGQLNFYLRVLMRDRLSHQNRSLMPVSNQCYLTRRCHPQRATTTVSGSRETSGIHRTFETKNERSPSNVSNARFMSAVMYCSHHSAGHAVQVTQGRLS